MKYNSPHQARGSILIVAMIFSVVIAISLGSFINLGLTNMRLSNRAFYANAAVNLAETGLEQAMWSINKAVASDASAWASWTVSGNNAWRDFTGFNYDANSTGHVRVYVQNHTLGVAPVIIARSSITPFNSGPIEKWIVVRLSKRSQFANGLVAKDRLSFSGGNAEVDSFDSRLGPYNAPLGGGLFNKYDRGSAGSSSISVDSVSLSNSNIFGFAAIGTADYSGLSVGPNGIIGSFGAAAGSVDYSRVTTDFTTNFPDVSAPATFGYSIGSINGATTLPRGPDVAAADGKFYYDVSSISLSGSPAKKLDITSGANVVIRITAAAGSTGVQLTGNASINVLANAKLEMYLDCDVAIGGKGIANANDPDAFYLRSTKTASSAGVQDIKVAGNGQLSAVVYAPHSDVTMNGGGSSGSVSGSVIADNINVTGGSVFHYDEALSAASSGDPFGIASWNELTTSDQRSTYSSLVSF
jgi:hypothetical protein